MENQEMEEKIRKLCQEIDEIAKVIFEDGKEGDADLPYPRPFSGED
jgi:hypothetical protein